MTFSVGQKHFLNYGSLSDDFDKFGLRLCSTPSLSNSRCLYYTCATKNRAHWEGSVLWQVDLFCQVAFHSLLEVSLKGWVWLHTRFDSIVSVCMLQSFPHIPPLSPTLMSPFQLGLSCCLWCFHIQVEQVFSGFMHFNYIVHIIEES